MYFSANYIYTLGLYEHRRRNDRSHTCVTLAAKILTIQTHRKIGENQDKVQLSAVDICVNVDNR